MNKNTQPSRAEIIAQAIVFSVLSVLGVVLLHNLIPRDKQTMFSWCLSNAICVYVGLLAGMVWRMAPKAKQKTEEQL
jgi:hypothetical protein